MSSYVAEFLATIANGAAVTGPIPTIGRTPLWIETPTGMTGSVITFLTRDAAGSDIAIRDPAGNELSLTLGAVGSRHSLFPTLAGQLAGHDTLILRAGTTASPALQGAARTLRIGVRFIL